MITINVNRATELLDSYWKKWEPYESLVTKEYIDLAKKDFLYRIELYNDLVKRNNSSHFYPLRTILEKLVKFEYLLNLTPEEREKWLYLDLTDIWENVSEDEPDEDKELNEMIQIVKENFTSKKVIRKIIIESTIKKSEIFSKDTYHIYRFLSEYDHESLFSRAVNEYGLAEDNKNFTQVMSNNIVHALEKLVEITAIKKS